MSCSVNDVWLVICPFGKLDPFITLYTEMDFKWLECIKVKEYKVVKGKYGFS